MSFHFFHFFVVFQAGITRLNWMLFLGSKRNTILYLGKYIHLCAIN